MKRIEIAEKVLIRRAEHRSQRDYRKSGSAAPDIFHCKDCCESVDLIDIGGDLADLVSGWPIDGEFTDGSETWSFVKLGTMDGRVTLRWYGSSNGYYCETPACAWFEVVRS